MKGTPDFVLVRKDADSRDVTATASSVHVCRDDELSVVEIKHPGHLTMPRHSSVNMPHAFALMMGGLHLVAACRVLRSAINGKILSKVICKGLLIKRKDKITTFTIKTNLCGMVNIQHQQLRSSDYSSLGYLSYSRLRNCACLQVLVNNALTWQSSCVIANNA